MSKNVSLRSLINPFPRQEEFLQTTDRYKYPLYGGAKGGGKSRILRWALLRLLLKWAKEGHRNVRVGLFCEDYPSLKDRQITKIKWEFPQWLGTLGDSQSEGLSFVLKPEFGSGVLALRNLDDPSKYACYNEGMEILTKKGFVEVKEIKVGDECLSLNPQSREMEWQRVSRVFAYDYDGEMYEYFGRFSVSFSVTPNHSMVYRTKRKKELRFVEASRLPVASFIPRMGHWNGVDSNEPLKFESGGNNGKKYQVSLDKFLDFLGWYLSEGCTDRSRFTISITQLHGKNATELKQMLDNLGVNWHYDGRVYSFNSRGFVDYLTQFGLSHEKFIPEQIKNLPKVRLEILFNSLMLGDGHKTRVGKYVYVTSSKRLRDDVSEIGFKLGYIPTVYTYPSKEKVYPNGKMYTQREYYHISLTKKNEDTALSGKVQRKPYKGKVYCVEVPPHHTVLIRHRGRTMFCGQSAEFAAAAIDELTKNERDVFDQLRSIVRWPGITHTPILGATNPGEIGHAWVKKLWIDRIFEDGDPDPLQVYFVKSLPTDNPYNSKGYIEELKRLPEKLRKAYLEGNWDTFAGQYFTEWSREQHTVRPFSLPASWKRFRAYDYGYESPACCKWYALDSDGRVWVYRELYFPDGHKTDAARQAAEIVRLSVDETYEYSIADPSIFSPTGLIDRSGSQTIAESFARNGILFIRGSNRRVDGWELVHRYLYWDEKQKPKLIYFTTCFDSIRTLPTLIHDQRLAEDVDTHGEDHALDTDRYFLMSLHERKSEKPKTEAEKKLEQLRRERAGELEPSVLGSFYEGKMFRDSMR